MSQSPCVWSESLARTLEDSPTIHWVTNYDRNLVWLNRAARTASTGVDYGLCPLPSSHYRAWVHPADRGALELAIDWGLRHNAGFDWLLRVLDRDGDWEWIEGFNWPARCPGGALPECAKCPGAVYVATVTRRLGIAMPHEAAGSASGFSG